MTVENLSQVLEKLSLNISSSRFKDRKEVIERVLELIDKNDLDQEVIKCISIVLQQSINVCLHPSSRYLVEKLIVRLVEKNSATFIPCFVFVLNSIAKRQKNIVVTKYTSHLGQAALQLSCIFLREGYKVDEKSVKAKLPLIIEIQSILLSSVVALDNEKLSKQAYNSLCLVWGNVPNSETAYLEQLLKEEQTQQAVVLGAFVIKRLNQDGKVALIEQHLEALVSGFIKNYVNCKKRPSPALIRACYPILDQVKDDTFGKLFVPSLQKTMLRNPEVILECVACVIEGTNLDLSRHATAIVENLISVLHSNDAEVRREAVNVCQKLSEKISDAKNVEEILKKIFSVFHGSSGKLTMADQKINVLQGAGEFSYSYVKDDLEELVKQATNMFLKVLDTEVHEKVLCHCLDMMALWGRMARTKVPEKVITTFKSKMDNKSTNVTVRTSFIQCLSVWFKNCDKTDAVPLIPVLIKAVDRAVAQATQPLSVLEGLTATCLILDIVTYTKNPNDDKLNNMWNVILDSDKQLFTSEKFMSSCGEQGALRLMHMCTELLLRFSDKLKGPMLSLLHKSILYCVTLSPTASRRECLDILQKTLQSANCSQLAQSLIVELHSFSLQNHITEKPSDDGSSSLELTPKILNSCITALCVAPPKDPQCFKDFCLDLIHVTHHPFMVEVAPHFWEKFIKHNGFAPETLIMDQAQSYKTNFIDQYESSKGHENVLSTLVRLSPDVIFPYLIESLISRLNKLRETRVTRDDYFIYLTPEDELYDKSLLHGMDDNTEINMKRENKVYSYKEQVEELQLRRELEDKKRKEGKIKPPQYTAKQLEAINNQKHKEAVIRNKLTQLNSVLCACVSMVKAAARGNPKQLSLYFRDLLPNILSNLQSPLSAPPLSDLFIDLRNVCMNKSQADIGLSIAYVTLRLLKPECSLDAEWEAEPLDRAVHRTIALVHQITVANEIDEQPVYFTAPTFCYSFALLEYVLLSKYVKNNEDLTHTCLHIVSHHAKIRGSRNSKIDLYSPKYLPTQQLFELLMQVISSSSGRVQTQAQSCLLDVAGAVAGKIGCATATVKEITVLLSALQNPRVVVRDTALRALSIILESQSVSSFDIGFVAKISKCIWASKFDANEENIDLANKLWESANLSFSENLCDELIQDLEHSEECVQLSAAKALVALLETSDYDVHGIVNRLLTMYNQHLKVIPAKLDEFGREVEKPIDIWYPRRGVALAITELAPLITPDYIGELIEFFVSTTLSDRHVNVRKEMLNAALKIVDLHGKETVSTLWPIFDQFMSKSSKSAHFDDVKQAVVILMGSLARHLEKDDLRIKPIVGRLIQALSTPSQTVQEAVANCLPHLVPSVKEEASGYINKLLHQLLKGDKYGERRGAAYGLAGLVKGLGILALRQHDIMNKLTDAIQDKKNYKHREGALFAFEMLFQMLGKLFEPYIVHVLPHLLQCFGDSSQYVRTAADDTAKVVMSKLSGHGVKLVLPSLLAALEEDSWRTKTGSVELLGDMAYCAPKQLSSCLPSIVPKLIEVLSDSHMKVQEAGATALKVIGSVIRNPEIQAIVPVLLHALQDPSNKTSLCLQTLLDTQFVHFIDAPSLALIMPVVQRAFMDRSTETRKMAAQIIGNMYSLTDQKDLMPYLPNIIPGLKTSLLDPVPEVRSVSARALGAMVRGMGESSFEDLLPWLMQTLTSETSSVDRSGAAQGLSEVVGGLGVEKLHKLMPEIISTAERTDIAPHVKDGYIMMFIYMPVVFTNEFTPYIGQIINPILKALADENEYVRETALKAGQRIVTLYADSAIALLLPELEGGLFDDNWRIRYSSVQLLGDLLYRISGVTGKMSTETASDDDNFGTEQSHQAIIRALGAERRNRVLAGLYMGRSDVALMVRQAALHVWKVVVTNTPRTLREILPTLFGLLLGCLASESYDKRQVAARTLGDLVRKLGERVLPEIIPILEEGLESSQPDQRQGVCIGLSEIMASTSKDMVLTFVNSLVPTVRKALCDPLPEVRQAAAKTFDSLHSTVGARALDDILPTMLNKLNDKDPQVVEWTLDGLRQVMAIKSRVVLPYLVPQLIAPPPNTKALSILASVAGEALNKYLPKILPALQSALAAARDTPEETQQLEYCQTVVLSVVDEVGIRTVIDTMLENTRHESADHRRAAATLLRVFCAYSKAQYTTHVPQLLRGLIHLCTDSDKDVLKMSWEALQAVIKTLEPKQQATYVSDVRQAVRYAMSDIKGESDLLPGFCLPKGITPILPIFREAILNGDADEKEAAAQGLGEVIRVTSADALQSSVVAITGPLIRILGDRFSPHVKIAVLDTLAILLSKVGVMLKQFIPQLQTTFLKSLTDSNRTVRLKSANALSFMIGFHSKADNLFTDMHNTIKNTDDTSIKETTLQALRSIITPAGGRMAENVKVQIHSTLLNLLSSSEDTTRNCAAGCLGALCKWLSPEQIDATLTDYLLVDDNNMDWVLRQGQAAALSVALKQSADSIWKDNYKTKIVDTIISQLQASKVSIAQAAVRSSGYLIQHLMNNGEQIPPNLLVPFVRTMNNNSNEVKQLLAKVCIHLAKTVSSDKMATDFLKMILPTLVNGTKEKNSFVKANSEMALIAVLKLKQGEEMLEKCLMLLDVGARESLSDVITKVLKKMINQPEGKEEELDDTLLT